MAAPMMDDEPWPSPLDLHELEEAAPRSKAFVQFQGFALVPDRGGVHVRAREDGLRSVRDFEPLPTMNLDGQAVPICCNETDHDTTRCSALYAGGFPAALVLVVRVHSLAKGETCSVFSSNDVATSFGAGTTTATPRLAWRINRKSLKRDGVAFMQVSSPLVHKAISATIGLHVNSAQFVLLRRAAAEGSQALRLDARSLLVGIHRSKWRASAAALASTRFEPLYVPAVVSPTLWSFHRRFTARYPAGRPLQMYMDTRMLDAAVDYERQHQHNVSAGSSSGSGSGSGSSGFHCNTSLLTLAPLELLTVGGAHCPSHPVVLQGDGTVDMTVEHHDEQHWMPPDVTRTVLHWSTEKHSVAGIRTTALRIDWAAAMAAQLRRTPGTVWHVRLRLMDALRECVVVSLVLRFFGQPRLDTRLLRTAASTFVPESPLQLQITVSDTCALSTAGAAVTAAVGVLQYRGATLPQHTDFAIASLLCSSAQTGSPVAVLVASRPVIAPSRPPPPPPPPSPPLAPSPPPQPPSAAPSSLVTPVSPVSPCSPCSPTLLRRPSRSPVSAAPQPLTLAWRRTRDERCIVAIAAGAAPVQLRLQLEALPQLAEAGSVCWPDLCVLTQARALPAAPLLVLTH